MSTFESGRQFLVDPFTAQTFYREPANGVYSPWTPLDPSDRHLPRPEAHNVLTRLPADLGPPTINPFASHVHAECDGQPPPPTLEEYPTSQLSSFDQGPPFTQPFPPVSSHSATAPPTIQNLIKTERNSRRVQRSTRAYDPIRGQRTVRPRESGRGRTRGSPNYKGREIGVLLDLVEEELPIASKGWRVVGSRFRDWASVSQNPSRTDRSLELKFKQLTKTRKPTGDGVCPPFILRAHEIDHKLRGKVACRDLEDGEIIEMDVNGGDSSDDEMSDADGRPEDTDRESPVRDMPAPRVRTTRVEAPLPGQDSVRQPSSKGADILEKISKTFDPEVQSRRDADRASSMFQAQQLILFQSQIRDLNNTILSLRNQLDDSERRRIGADRRADRLQNQIDITSAVTRARLYRPATRVPRHTTPITISSTPESTPDRDRRFEATFHDGGRCTWFGNGDRFDEDNDVLEVTRVPWSPPPPTPTPSPARSEEV